MASSARRAAEALKLYNFPKPDILTEEGSHLPQSFKKFYKEWKLTEPKAVHYQPPTEKWIRNDETGEVKPVGFSKIPVKYPPESHRGLWGGEGVIKGFQKRNRYKQRVPHFWVPTLKKSAVYSEILNLRMEVTITERTIDLILQHQGFDNYILQNKACDLQSMLALKLKKKMLQALYYKELYPDDPVKREQVYNKYQHFLGDYTAEDIEWYGLTLDEALRKDERLKAEQNKPVPLKHALRLQLINRLIEEKDSEKSSGSDGTENAKSTWIKSLNPFSGR